MIMSRDQPKYQKAPPFLTIEFGSDAHHLRQVEPKNQSQLGVSAEGVLEDTLAGIVNANRFFSLLQTDRERFSGALNSTPDNTVILYAFREWDVKEYRKNYLAS